MTLIFLDKLVGKRDSLVSLSNSEGNWKSKKEMREFCTKFEVRRELEALSSSQLRMGVEKY